MSNEDVFTFGAANQKDGAVSFPARFYEYFKKREGHFDIVSPTFIEQPKETQDGNIEFRCTSWTQVILLHQCVGFPFEQYLHAYATAAAENDAKAAAKVEYTARLPPASETAIRKALEAANAARDEAATAQAAAEAEAEAASKAATTQLAAAQKELAEAKAEAKARDEAATAQAAADQQELAKFKAEAQAEAEAQATAAQEELARVKEQLALVKEQLADAEADEE